MLPYRVIVKGSGSVWYFILASSVTLVTVATSPNYATQVAAEQAASGLASNLQTPDSNNPSMIEIPPVELP